jgi:hypothetical protein
MAVPITDALAVLYPAADPTRDYAVSVTGAGAALARWDAALGPQPTPAQLAAVTAADVTAARLARVRAAAKAFMDALDAAGQRDRGIVLVSMDEVNALRDWVTQFKAATAAAATLADLKTRVAALPNLPQRTAAQAKAAIKARIDTDDAGA